MQISVITPETQLYEGEITLLQVPGSNGSLEIMNNHAPLVSALGSGQVKIVPVGQETIYYSITSGVVEVNNNKVSLLIEALK